MNKFFVLSVILCFWGLLHSEAQISRIADNILGTKPSVNENEQLTTKKDSLAKADSLKIAELTQQIQQLKLNELHYLNELEKTQSTYKSDSIRQNRYKAHIDSLRKVTAGMPLVVDGDTLFSFYAARGGVTTADRATDVRKMITEMGKKRNVRADSVYLLPLENGHQVEIMYKGKVLHSVTGDDALWMNMPIDSLAHMQRTAIVEAITKIQKKNSWLQMFKRVFFFILVIVIQFFIFKATNWLYGKFKHLVVRNAKTKFKPVVFRDYELLNTTRQARIVVFLGNITRYVLILLQLLITVPILFSIFPQTKNFATRLFGYIITPVKSIFMAVIDYVPNLFVIIIIWLGIRYVVKGIHYVAREIQNERLKISGFYPDWALPTFNILKFLLYAFMIAMIYPYLPGSESGVFQGVSIFVGLIVSLGSSSVIGNIMAGMVITYMRPFKIGDRIKLNDTLGNVIEKTPFVTRIRTPKNEIITIPNSFIMSSHTTNYSASARDYGLIIHSDIAIGYEVPWQKAHECLIRAARQTKGILQDREPFVLDVGLEDYYNTYQINVYISDADKIPAILTDLHSKIQDVFIEEGIDMESPFLISERKEPHKKR